MPAISHDLSLSSRLTSSHPFSFLRSIRSTSFFELFLIEAPIYPRPRLIRSVVGVLLPKLSKPIWAMPGYMSVIFTLFSSDMQRNDFASHGGNWIYSFYAECICL